MDVCVCVCVWGQTALRSSQQLKTLGAINTYYLTHVWLCVHSCACACADLAGPLARLLVERLGSCENGLIDRLVGGHHQQFWLIVILTISKLIFIIYLPLLYCLLILRLGGAFVGDCWWRLEDQLGWEGKGGRQRRVGGGGGGKKEECGEEGESQGWQEGRKHGKRRHLVQYERHWMEEQRTGRRSEYKHCEGAGRRGGGTARTNKDGGKIGRRSWFGQVAGG